MIKNIIICENALKLCPAKAGIISIALILEFLEWPIDATQKKKKSTYHEKKPTVGLYLNILNSLNTNNVTQQQ